MNWSLYGQEITTLEQFPKGVIGFIYEITFSNGMKYIGKKSLFHNRTLPPLKGKKRKRKKVVESDWAKYCGSIKNEKHKEGIKSKEIFVLRKEIIHLCEDKWDLTYYETKFQFERDCLLSDKYYNANILGKFYRKPKK